MTAKELTNSCQNQWKGLFGINKEFKVIFEFTQDEGEQIFDFRTWNYDFDDDEEGQLLKLVSKRHRQEVLAWHMDNKNEIHILVRER